MSQQNCNIPYSGGSYLFSPVKGPLNSNNTPKTVDNTNNGVTNAKHGEPFKTSTCDMGGSHAIHRRMYRDTTLGIEGSSNYSQNDNIGSSLVIRNNKVDAIGQSSFNDANMKLSFKSANISDEKNAKERSRRSGYVVSKKFRVKLLPPPSVTRIIFKDKKYQPKS